MPSRCFPPSPAANQATAKPSTAAAPRLNARMTALFRRGGQPLRILDEAVMRTCLPASVLAIMGFLRRCISAIETGAASARMELVSALNRIPQ